MAKSPGESKIPVFYTTPLKNRISKPLSTLSSRVRAHLDTSKSRASPSSVLLNILSVTGGNLRNVTIAKPVTVSQLTNNTTHSFSHDDLKTVKSVKRPTNIFTSGHYFPLSSTAVGTAVGHNHEFAITGVENVGKRVRLNSGKEGVLRFVGQTQFGEGLWCGVELDTEEGSSDGTANNVCYFSCAKNRGVFALASNVCLVSEEVREYLSDVSDSGPHSLLGVTGDVKVESSSVLQNDAAGNKASGSDVIYFRKDSAYRYSSSSQQQSSQTPTPNSSNSSYIPSCEWKCNSHHSSSASSLVVGQRGPTSCGLDLMSMHMSKHSSIECDESLGILTPDQMAELTTCSGEDSIVLGGGSCDDFRSLAFQEHGGGDGKDSYKSDLNGIVEPKMKCPSMDSITVSPAPLDCYKYFNDSIPENGQNELLDRLFSETDTCMMTISSISDNLENSREISGPLRMSSVEELPVDDLSTTLIAPNQQDVVDIPVSAPSTSFVTSVTSIGSWDNGYQGDGECSRPTSRGADTSPLTRVPKIISKILEPMTDSDFFTESDVDLCEDVSCLRGDRKARVIDGKLFGSPVNTKITTSQSYSALRLSTELYNVQHERCVPEEMDSSGIYSDLDKKSDGVKKPVDGVVDVAMLEEVHSDTSGKSSSKSVSSQKLVSEEVRGLKKEGTFELVERKPKLKSSVPQKSTILTKSENGLKRRNEIMIKNVESSKLSDLATVNKPKMARRNVTSKVKTMIAASSKCSEDENQENHQPVHQKNLVNKSTGKWNPVLSRIEKNRNDEKQKPVKLKDVKSKVVCSMPRMPPSKLHKDVKPFSPNGNAINKVAQKNSSVSLSGSLRSLKDNSSHRFKNRKTRSRTSNVESPLQSSAVTAPANLSHPSSKNSSITDISDSHLDISQHSLPAVVVPAEYSKGKKTSNLLCSPLNESAVSTVPQQAVALTAKDVKIATLPRSRSTLKQQIGSVNCLVENSTVMKGPKKMTCRRMLPKVIPLKDQNRVQSTNSAGTCSVIGKTNSLKPLPDHTNRPADSGKCTKIKVKTSLPSAKVSPLLAQLKYATDGMEAFIILFQRLTSDMDVFALSSIKQELSHYQKEWLDMKLKLEEANAGCRRLKEEIELQKLMYDQKLAELKEIHSAALARLNELHAQELEARSDSYEKKLRDAENRLRDQEVALQLKFNDDLRQIQKEAEDKLGSILEETKNQVEMLKSENDIWKEKLIKESWKKLEEVERKFKNKMERMETSYSNQLNEAEEEARKREELFLTSMKRKPADYHQTEPESNSEIGKLYLENTSHSAKQDSQNLEEEICSLRVVLDLKHSEIQDLRKQNEKLRKEAQDLPFIAQKLDSAQARVEDLNAQLQTKIETEKQLLKENRKLLETVQQESEKKKRLTFQNEELLWKLKKSTQVAKTLAVFNSNLKKDEYVSESERCLHSTPKNVKHCRIQHNCNTGNREKYLKRSRTDADIKLIESPSEGGDASPKVLGVVEKSDSVSWVLEIDESPLTVASRMLRRANSLRGVPSNKKKSNHDQQSLTLPSRNKKSTLPKVSTPLIMTTSDPTACSSSNTEPITQSRVDNENCADASASTSASELVAEVAVTSLSSSLPSSPSPARLRHCDDEDETIIGDIASFFDFLQDSDFETELIASEHIDLGCDNGGGSGSFYTNEKGLTSPFSSTSSDSSLEFELYSKEAKSKSHSGSNPRFTWTKTDDAECGIRTPLKSLTDSSGLSDTEDSEWADSFPSSSLDVELEKLIHIPTNRF